MGRRGCVRVLPISGPGRVACGWQMDGTAEHTAAAVTRAVTAWKYLFTDTPRKLVVFHPSQSSTATRPRSSGDRASASGAGCAGSNPAGGTSSGQHDHAADQAERVSQQAYEAAEASAVAASEVEEALTDIITQARDLRKKISNGLVSDKDARETLGNLRKLHAELVTRTASIKTVYEGATRDIEDPAARVAALKSKYSALRR